MTTTSTVPAQAGAPPTYPALVRVPGDPVRVIAAAQQKGGVGKTNTVLHLSGALASRGLRVLAIDWDPQGALTAALGMGYQPDGQTLAAYLLGTYTGPAAALAHERAENLSVVTTNLDAFLLGPSLYQVRAREKQLARFIRAYCEELGDDRPDVVLIDCPPALDLMTDNAFWAARGDGGALIVAEAEDSIFLGLNLLYGQMDALAEAMETTVRRLGVVINGYDARRGTMVRQVHDKLHEMQPEVFGVVPDRAVIREAYRARTTVQDYAPEHETAALYLSIADRMMREVRS